MHKMRIKEPLAKSNGFFIYKKLKRILKNNCG